jgi:hypothetical protein
MCNVNYVISILRKQFQIAQDANCGKNNRCEKVCALNTTPHRNSVVVIHTPHLMNHGESDDDITSQLVDIVY